MKKIEHSFGAKPDVASVAASAKPASFTKKQDRAELDALTAQIKARVNKTIAQKQKERASQSAVVNVRASPLEAAAPPLE